MIKRSTLEEFHFGLSLTTKTRDEGTVDGGATLIR
jgi:hypothetical protein